VTEQQAIHIGMYARDLWGNTLKDAQVDALIDHVQAADYDRAYRALTLLWGSEKYFSLPDYRKVLADLIEREEGEKRRQTAAEAERAKWGARHAGDAQRAEEIEAGYQFLAGLSDEELADLVRRVEETSRQLLDDVLPPAKRTYSRGTRNGLWMSLLVKAAKEGVQS
jgi:hypothetical protein